MIIAAFATRGLCSALFEVCLDRCTIIISEHILSEVSRILLEKIKMPTSKVKPILEYLREFCELHGYESLKENVCRDKDDDEILALAKSSKADHIISWDKDLLVLGTFNSIPIVSPREFWEILKRKNSA